ncbi:MAG TPA: insulinase family protein [Patescibacteria group bacterium]|nr:insulinase family protein [Patescibacteria group bacterium]
MRSQPSEHHPPRAAMARAALALAGLALAAVALATAAIGSMALAAAPRDADPFAAARTVHLDNGLTVVLARVPGRPVVAVQVYYRVGARNEPTGVTGIAHFVEHMLFRGTTSFGLADVTGVIERAGGEWHGYTWLDGTTYFEAAPAALLPELLHLEAERMTSARMAPAEVDPERGAVFQEYRGYQLDARSDLADAVGMMQFLEHPYRNNTMGWESDLAAITPADLVAFYRRWYGPRNVVLAIAGDIDPDDAERQVRDRFGSIPAAGDDPRLRTVEPAPEGQRRLLMARPGAVPALLVSFPAPAAPDARPFAALLVLDAILGRAKGLSFERHSGDLTIGLAADPASRLGALLGEGGPAASIGTALVATAYPYQYLVGASPAHGRTLDEVETRLFAVLAQTAKTLTQDEVASARRRIAAADDLETDGLVELNHEMAFWSALGGLERRAAVRREVESVPLEEVRAAAARLIAARSVVGRLVPEGSPEDDRRPAAGARPALNPAPAGPPSGPAMAATALSDGVAATPSVATFQLGNDGRVIVDARPAQRTFVLRCLIAPAAGDPAGEASSALLRGAAAELRADGATRGRFAAAGIAVAITGPDDGPLAERGTLRIDLAGPAALLAEAAQRLAPALSRALRKDAATAPGSSDDPAERAIRMLEEARGATPPATPRSWRLLVGLVSPLGERAARAALAPIAAAAGAAPHAASHAARPPAGRDGAAAEDPARPFTPGRRDAAIPGIAQGRLLYAIPGDADAAAQEAVAWLLHHNYSGRLGVKAIAEMGLVYEMESESLAGARPLVYVSMGADPEALGRLDAALGAVLATAAGGLTEQELAGYRSYARGALTVRLADPDRATRIWTAALLRGEDDRGPARHADQAASLTLDKVSAAARRMLDPARRLVVTVGRAAPGAAAASR